MAFVLRMLARNLLPSPSPFEAPFTSPAISTISMVVGTTRLGLSISASRMSRSSGTVMTPTLGSIVQKGKFAACALALDRQLKRVDLPTLGSPTIPHCKAIEYLSFLILSVRQASAKCRCPREDGRYTVVRKCKDTNKPRAKSKFICILPRRSIFRRSQRYENLPR